MSLADLQRMFRMKESQIAALVSRRHELASELASIEADLAAASGGGRQAAAPASVARRSLSARKAGRRRKAGRPRMSRRPAKAARPAKVGRPRGAAGRRGPRGDEGVHNFIRKVLAVAAAPMKLAEVAKRVLAAGYKTTSSRFAVIVGQRLSEMKDVKKAGRGMYSLRG